MYQKTSNLSKLNKDDGNSITDQKLSYLQLSHRQEKKKHAVLHFYLRY